LQASKQVVYLEAQVALQAVLRQVASKKGTPVNDIQLYHGDCLEIMPTLEAQSVDAIIAASLDSRAILGLCGNYGKD